MATTAKDREQHCANKVHTESHSLVLGKEDLKPTRHVVGLVKEHPGLDLELDKLVDNQDQEDDPTGHPGQSADRQTRRRSGFGQKLMPRCIAR